MILHHSMRTCCSLKELGAFNDQTKESLEKFAATGRYAIETSMGKQGFELAPGQTILFTDMPAAGSGVGIQYKANAMKYLIPAIKRKKNDKLFQSELINKRPDNLGVFVFLWTFNGPDSAAIEG